MNRARGVLRVLAALVALGCCAAPIVARAAPIRGRIAGCRPIDYLDWSDTPTNGSGNVPLRRSVAMTYDLFTHPEDDARARDGGIVAETHRIEVCLARGGVIRCPGHGTTDEPWVLFDDSVRPPVMRLSTHPPVTTLAELDARLLSSTSAGARFYTELLPVDVRNDWDDSATAGTFYVLRVNNESLGPLINDAGAFAPAFVVEGGFCGLPRRMAASADGHFLAYGVDAQPAWPFPGPMPLRCRDPKNAASCVAQDACVDGAKAIGPGGAPFHAHSHCARPVHAQFMVDRASEIDRWQREVAVAKAPPSPAAWTNGTDSAACPSPSPDGPCPSRIFLAPIEAGGQGTNGGIAVNTSLFPATPLVPLSAEGGGIVSLTAHELAHKLQDAFIRQAVKERDVDPPGLHLPSVAESVPTAIQAHLCIEGYGGITSRKCVSPGMLGQTGAAAHSWLDSPSSNVLDMAYTSAVAWRYAMEQFAVPVASAPNSPHPGGRTSLLPSDRARPLGHPERRSDEGADLVGLLVSALATRTDEPPFEGPFNDVLVEQLGRNLENVVLDLHTTLALKEYREIDPRWTMDWVGDMNAGATAPLVAGWPMPLPPMAARKPVAVPPDLRAAGPDHLPRARRELDSYEVCVGDAKRCPAARPRPLVAGGGFASGAPSLLHGYGAAILSAIPTPGSAGLTVRVAPQGRAPLRLRVFAIDPRGTPSLVPGCREPLSGPPPAPQEECRPREGGDYVVDVPVGPDVAEVVAVVSNTKPTDALFGWRLGEAAATAALLTPTRATQADIGHPSAARRPFRIEIAVRDERNEPARARLDSIRVALPGCGNAGGCNLPPSNYTTVEVSRGTVWIIGTVPDAFYGNVGAALNLEVHLATAAGAKLRVAAESALIARRAPPKVVAALVLDRSGSMDDGDGAKLAATKIAARAALDGLRDGDEVGLVTFNHDAQTIFPVKPIDAASRPDMAKAIDAVRALGWTSVGDGALEGASNLVAAGYDERKGDDPALAMLVLSDGRSNAGYEIERYTLFPPYAGYTDGTNLPPGAFDLEDLGPDNLPWPTGTSGLLGWTQRAHFRSASGATYLVPRVSTVAIGQDADAAPLRSMADICGGAFSYADGLSRAADLPAAAVQVGDAVLGGLASATSRDRLMARSVKSLDELPPIELAPATFDVLVTVISTDVSLDQLHLRDATGRRYEPSHRAASHVVFRLDAPPATTLRLASTGALAGHMFVEVTARATGAMFTHVDVDGVPPPPTDGRSALETGRFAGQPLRLVAALRDVMPVGAATVMATVRAPDQHLVTFALLDDGAHGDGAPDDGVYGGTYYATSAPGVYDVVLRARASGETVLSRDAHVAIALTPPRDADGDGLPDVWERAQGTDPVKNDAREDPDGDGLDNATELRLGTSALRADTDGGGESDGSEVAAGRSPTNASDDEARSYPVRVVAGTARVTVEAASTAGRDRSLEVRRASRLTGPFVGATCNPVAGSGVRVLCAATPAKTECWSARVRSGKGPLGAVSGWSSPVCVRPSLDPDPPRVTGVSLVGSPFAKTRDVTLSIDASDAPHNPDPLRDPAAARSGLASLRVDLGAKSGAWQPFRREVAVRLPVGEEPSVRVWVRDAAGNVSPPFQRSFRAAHAR